jgi:hypothetical protein
MTKRKLWTYLAAGSALAIALSSAALGANSTGSNGDATIPAALGHAASVTVLGALTGGSNPSTIASNGNATSQQATQTNADETTTTNVSAGQETSPALTTGTKPGWGCGDLNHVHTGPPGRPDATPPPGCAKAQ